MDFKALNNDIKALDVDAMEQARIRWREIAKPVGSFGFLEDVITSIAGMTGKAPILNKRAVIVFCADNGVTAAGVAATPAEITAVMTGFIAQKRSAVGIMATHSNADVITVDMGMFSTLTIPDLLDRRIADGTQNMAERPAMTREQALQGIATGMALVDDCAAKGYNILATGEMGIGNTTTSAAIASVLLSRPLEEVVGRGAGLDDEGLARKTEVLQRALEVNKPDASDPVDVLAKVGGFDIAGMCGMFLGGAKNGIPVIVDGVISAISALLAVRLCPAARNYLVASHLSVEPAAAAILKELELTPPIHAGMRLGEGTGAIAVLPLLDLTLAVFNELMTYSDIGM